MSVDDFNIYTLVADERFAVYASIIIVLIGVVTLVRYIFKIAPVYLNIKKVIKQLGTTRGENEFCQNYDELNNIFLKNKVIRHSWYEFTEGLLVGETKVRNTKKAMEYFNRETLIYGHMNLPFYQSMPNILTGLGILGTFLGLLCGVSQVNINEISTIELLLHGASFSFYTSIAGLSASIIFTLVKRGSFFLIDAQIQKWVGMLDSRLEWLSPEKIAYISLENQKLQVRLFEGLADKLGVKLSDSLEDISRKEISLLSEIRDNTVPEVWAPLKDQLSKNNQLISEGFENLWENLSAAKTDIINAISDQSNNEILLLKDIKHNTALERWESIENEMAQNRLVTSEGFTAMAENLNGINSDIIKTLSQQNSEVIGSIKHIEKSFEEFKEKMVEENMQSVIQALEVVVKDFNEQINEQLGENFKEYNEAILNLLEWQKEHKDHIDKLHGFLGDYYQKIETGTETLVAASGALKAMSFQITEIVEKLSRLSMTSEKIETTLQALNDENRGMEAFISAIKKIGDDAAKSIPELGKKIDACAERVAGSAKYLEGKVSEITDSLSQTQQSFSDNAVEISNEALALVTDLSEKIDVTTDVMSKATEHASKKIESTSVAYATQVDKTAGKLAESIEAMLNKSLASIETTADTMNKTIEDTAKKMEQVSLEHAKQVDKTTEQIETQLSNTLNESLSSLANSMITLSNKFVEDYKPLTEKLREVVRIAESIEKR